MWVRHRYVLSGVPAYTNTNHEIKQRTGRKRLYVPHEIGSDHSRFPEGFPHLREHQFWDSGQQQQIHTGSPNHHDESHEPALVL